MRTHTGTYTRFFTLEDIEPILKELDKLAEDWHSRREHITIEDCIIGDGLMSGVKSSIAMLISKAS